MIDTDGRPVASVGMPSGLPLMDVRGSRRAGVARDDPGVERMEVVRLLRGPD